jgi:ATP-dependent DNA ligase
MSAPSSRLPAPSRRPGNGWLHEPKHDGWRLIAIVDGNGAVKLLSRQGLDHTQFFSAPFGELAATSMAMVLDGEIAVPNDDGLTHLD